MTTEAALTQVTFAIRIPMRPVCSGHTAAPQPAKQPSKGGLKGGVCLLFLL